MKRVLCINTGGKGNLHGLRMRRLAKELNAEVTYYDVDRTVSRYSAVKAVWELLNSNHWDLVYQESTGLIGGINLIRASLSRKVPFIVSSGDPIAGFFRVTQGPMPGCFFSLYEQALYRSSKAFVGWTPYLTGAALGLGAKKAITIEGAVDLNQFYPQTQSERLATRQKHGIHPEHLVCGNVGSINWSKRQAYCYGLELIESLKYTLREDVSLLIVGDGDAVSKLKELVPLNLKSRVHFTGRLPEAEVAQAMNAMNIGFVTQTLDALGNYRLTTKLPEYLACGLPVAMSPNPGFYDYVVPAGWPLPAHHPSSPEFHRQCGRWLDQLSWDEVAQKASLARGIAQQSFDYEILSKKFCDFVNALLEDEMSTV